MARARQAVRSRTPSVEVTESIEAAALAMLEESGLASLTVRSVATRAGVAPMGVYSRFGSKDGLLEALFVAGFRRLQEAIEIPPQSGAMRRLREGCAGYRDFAVSHPQLYHLMFEQMMTLELSEEAYATAQGTFSTLVERVTAAMDTGELSSGPPIEVAQQIWSAMHGAVSLEIAGVHFAEDQEASYLALIDTLLAGLSPRS